MNDIKNELDALMISILKGRGETSGLHNDIMKKISGVTIQRKARKAKEKIVMWSYIGLTLIVLLVMVILTAEFQVNMRLWKAPSTHPEFLKVYYALIIMCSVLSVISFTTYFLRSRRFAG